MFVNNYHTHTARCHHAVGSDRAYVEAAISAGLRELGFSDHCPYVFPGNYYSGFRMEREDLPGYLASLEALRAEYADRIRILIGFEMEYYPDCFERTLDLLAPYRYDYLILGQHFLGNEEGDYPCTSLTDEEARLAGYTEQVCRAMDTGKFSYIAHPDVLNYRRDGDPKVYEKYARRLCECAKRNNMPLEFNFLGFRGRRNYPREDFFRIAGEVGCRVIFGCDAHEPESLRDFALAKAAEEWCQKFHLEQEITLVPKYSR